MTKQEPPRNKKIYDRSTKRVPNKPSPPLASPDDIWERIYALDADDTTSVPTSSDSKTRKRGAARRQKRRQRWARALDVIGVTLWALAGLRLVFGDLDRVLLGTFAPDVVWILDFSWIVLLALVALLLVLFKATTLGLSLAYVVAYPLVILLWKIPKYIAKKRSALLAVGLVGFVLSVAVRTKRFVIALTIACISAALIAFSDTMWSIVAGMTALALTFGWWLVMTAIDLFRAPGFVAAQDKWIKSLLGMKLIENLIYPDHPDQLAIKKWSADDAKKYRDTAGNALLARRILAFWAFLLDEFRKGPAIVVLNAMTAISVIVQTMIVFAFLNYGAFLIDPGAFLTLADPDMWTFVYYSGAAMYFSEITTLVPLDGLAVVAKFLTGMVGSVFVLTVVVSIVMSFRHSRADSSAGSSIEMLRSKAEHIETTSFEQFGMELLELEDRLAKAGWEALGLLTWLTLKLPSGWLDAKPVRGADAPHRTDA